MIISPFISEDDSGTIAFTAYFWGEKGYNAGDLIIFDNILTNIGGYYQNDTSTFICGRAGVYVFSWTIHAWVQLASELMIENASSHIQTYSFNNYGSTFKKDLLDTSSVTVIVECYLNQRVWLKSILDDSCITSYPGIRSLFSGFLVQSFSWIKLDNRRYVLTFLKLCVYKNL